MIERVQEPPATKPKTGGGGDGALTVLQVSFDFARDVFVDLPEGAVILHAGLKMEASKVVVPSGPPVPGTGGKQEQQQEGMAVTPKLAICVLCDPSTNRVKTRFRVVRLGDEIPLSIAGKLRFVKSFPWPPEQTMAFLFEQVKR